ncbi:MAG: hypothetical protein ACKVHO_03055 [Verrucomicrobiia bacterium]
MKPAKPAKAGSTAKRTVTQPRSPQRKPVLMVRTKSIAADYIYAMEFEGDRVRHMTKIWSDGISRQHLGWA